MIVAVHQPQYLPWLGYFDKIRIADVFCYLDNVQYKKNEWQNRNRIKTAQNWQWLTVPVHYRFPQKINEVEINNSVNWKKKHLQALITNYSKAPYFKDYITPLEDLFTKDWELLSEFNIGLLERLREFLNLHDKPAIPASSMVLRDDPTERLIDICKTVGADTYLAGQDGRTYMDLERFRANGITVITQEFKHPVYPQLYDEFQSHMSIVDLLFNCGPESIKIIEAANPS
ncbi:MAG: WbqC family protein [Desulfobacterales bacterium]|nr:MAG: WbqC family protein [Desulfobacterales bacterium]